MHYMLSSIWTHLSLLLPLFLHEVEELLQVSSAQGMDLCITVGLSTYRRGSAKGYLHIHLLSRVDGLQVATHAVHMQVQLHIRKEVLIEVHIRLQLLLDRVLQLLQLGGSSEQEGLQLVDVVGDTFRGGLCLPDELKEQIDEEEPFLTDFGLLQSVLDAGDIEPLTVLAIESLYSHHQSLKVQLGP